MTEPDVRVGIVSWNTADLLERCLLSLPAAFASKSFEVVVVDNASGDGSADVAERVPGVRVERNTENAGYARAMNQALSGSRAGYLIALNPDTVPPPGSLARLVDALAAQPDVALAAPRLVNPDGSLQHSVYRFPSLKVAFVVACLPLALHRGGLGRRFWLEGHAPHDRSQRVDWAIGAVHCIRAAGLAGDPVYRERWFMYVEDLDLSWRLRRRGWATLFVADVEVVHVGNASGAQAWGDSRTARWLDATYDWYALERGTVAAWVWAAVSTVGMAGKLAFATLGLGLHLPGRPRRRAWASQLRGWLGLHGKKLFRGPRVPLADVPAAVAARR
jgi:GT2 family glycosyltransferase